MKLNGILFLVVTFLGTLLVSTPAFANIVGEDDRFYVSEVYQSMGLDMAEMLRIRHSTGFIYCPGTVHRNPIMASAALVHQDNVIVTIAHAFIDGNGNRRSPLSACYFQSQGLVIEQIALDFSSRGVEASLNWRNNRNVNDFAVARLVSPMKYGRAFPLAPSTHFAEGHSFILVSAIQERKAKPFSGLEPIVQSCLIRKNFERNEKHGDLFYGDCDVKPGGSGSVGLMRVGGHLHAFSVASAGGFDMADGVPYSIRDGSYSFHTYFSSGLLDAIQRVSVKGVPELGAEPLATPSKHLTGTTPKTN